MWGGPHGGAGPASDVPAPPVARAWLESLGLWGLGGSLASGGGRGTTCCGSISGWDVGVCLEEAVSLWEAFWAGPGSPKREALTCKQVGR